MRVVAVGDVGGAVHNEGGLDVGDLADHVAESGSVEGFGGGEPIPGEAIWDIECELLVPAALGGVIDADVAERVAAKVVVEAANGPTTSDAQPILDRRGVVVVPDILANAGGVTASYFEWAQAQQGYPWDDQVVAERLRQRMEHAFTAVWARAQTLGVSMRTAAHVVAVERVADAITARGLFP
jgi:glutamate dehydrogenase (NAD(P)+)